MYSSVKYPTNLLSWDHDSTIIVQILLNQNMFGIIDSSGSIHIPCILNHNITWQHRSLSFIGHAWQWLGHGNMLSLHHRLIYIIYKSIVQLQLQRPYFPFKIIYQDVAMGVLPKSTLQRTTHLLIPIWEGVNSTLQRTTHLLIPMWEGVNYILWSYIPNYLFD